MSNDLVFGEVSELGVGASIELLSMSPPPKLLVGNQYRLSFCKCFFYDACGVCNVMGVSLKPVILKCCIVPTLRHT